MEDEVTTPEETIETVEEVATLETEEAVEAETQETDTPEASTESTTETTAEDNKQGYERRQKFKAQKERADTLAQENERLKEQMRINMQNAQPQPQAQAPVQQQYRDPNAPQLDDYEDTTLYIEDVISYKEHNRSVQAKSKSQVDKFTELEEAYRLNNTSYDDDLAYGHNTPPSQVIAQEILKSPHGPQLLQAFKKDEALARRLNGMEQGDAIRELIQLEGKVKVKSAVSSAPAPINTPKTSMSKGSNKFSGDESQAEYTKRMNEYRRNK
jgi:hypothetical protein